MTNPLPALAAALAIAGGAAAQSPAPAPATPVRPATAEVKDERCMAAFAYVASKGGDLAEAGKLGTTFFYGKLIGRNPALPNDALVIASKEVATMLQAELTRCSGELQAAGTAMAAIGQATDK